MGRDERIRAVHDVLEAYARSDALALRRLLTDDVVWWVPPSAAGRYPRPIVGIEAVLEVLAGPSLAYDKPTIRWTVHHVVADDGDIVMAAATMTGTLLNGNPYTNEYAFLYRFDGGRVAETTEYADTAHAMAQAAATPPNEA